MTYQAAVGIIPMLVIFMAIKWWNESAKKETKEIIKFVAFSAVVSIGSHYENPEGRNPSAVTFCDYASAGNEWSPDDHYRTWFPVERSPYDDLRDSATTRRNNEQK